ncbi:MAG TPA: class I SAM-dependent methyltransferase [Candidatus Eremiobacteraceae bacterium]|nr:class I SAM-dependent methyltransferase [Candidatus Eremiobacteraceae bacterium]
MAPRSRAIDAGCGTGGLLAKLAADRPRAVAIGLDAHQQACERATVKRGRAVAERAGAPMPRRSGLCRR